MTVKKLLSCHFYLQYFQMKTIFFQVWCKASSFKYFHRAFDLSNKPVVNLHSNYFFSSFLFKAAFLFTISHKTEHLKDTKSALSAISRHWVTLSFNGSSREERVTIKKPLVGCVSMLPYYTSDVWICSYLQPTSSLCLSQTVNLKSKMCFCLLLRRIDALHFKSYRLCKLSCFCYF